MSFYLFLFSLGFSFLLKRKAERGWKALYLILRFSDMLIII